MDYNILKKKNLNQLREIAEKMDISSVNLNRKELLDEIIKCFKEYEEYKKDIIKKYDCRGKIGNTGKDGITYLVKKNGVEYAMKTFRDRKSVNSITKESQFQKNASMVGISPKIYEVNLVDNYIVMDKMDRHLVDVIKEQGGILNEMQQRQIINIFKKLDEIKIFHGDSNILNYMCKGQLIYMIDFGMSKAIDSKMIRKLGTDRPNYELMNIGFILKLKELKFDKKSYNYLVQHVSKDNINKYKI
jgi:predicted Ser/Thr protein kinase